MRLPGAARDARASSWVSHKRPGGRRWELRGLAPGPQKRALVCLPTTCQRRASRRPLSVLGGV